MTLISGPVVFGYGQIFVLPEVVAKTYNQILEKNKLKALDKNNQVTNFFANRKERKYFNCSFLVFNRSFVVFVFHGNICENFSKSRPLAESPSLLH